MLILPIKKKWFDMILRKEKLEEYREIKPYWTKRLLKSDIPFDLDKLLYKLRTGEGRFCKTVIFKNGYRKNNPKMQCRVEIGIGNGKQGWGAEKRKRILHSRDIRDIGGAECSIDVKRNWII